MEVVLKNVSCKKYDQKLEKMNFTIPSSQIVGIMGEGRTLLLEYLDGQEEGRGVITFDKIKRTKDNMQALKRETGIVQQMMKIPFLLDTVEKNMRFFIRYYRLSIKNLDRKLEEALKMVGLDSSYLEKNINHLSASETKLLQIAICLLTNPKILLLDEPFINLDTASQKKLMNLFRLLKEKYHKTIVIASHDSNLLYENTEYLIILGEHTCLAEGKTTSLFQNVPFLLEHRLEVPDLIYFTYWARQKKNVRLSYHKDIRDLIKDIYKHVTF